MRCVLAVVLTLLLAPLPGFSQQAVAPAAHPPGTAIASAHALATDAGMDIIRQGGNAFDAAVAVSSVLSVVEPISSGLGGGGFFLLHDGKTGKDVFVDARETAPAAATPAAYLDKDGDLDRDRAAERAMVGRHPRPAGCTGACRRKLRSAAAAHGRWRRRSASPARDSRSMGAWRDGYAAQRTVMERYPRHPRGVPAQWPARRRKAMCSANPTWRRRWSDSRRRAMTASIAASPRNACWPA